MPSAEDESATVNATRFTRTALATALGLAILAACDSAPKPEARDAVSEEAGAAFSAAAPDGTAGMSASRRLAEVLDAQSEEIKARYAARHPAETLMFFGVEPGMTVAEADPGAGWYSGILLSYLGEAGTLIGADYPMGVYRLFNYYSDEELEEKLTWSDRWPAEIAEGVAGSAAVEAYAIGSMPEALEGSVDVFLLVRALHNLADFEEEGAYLSQGLAEVYRALKPGGVVGVVQHSGPESHSDDWASGGNGYLKESFVIASMEAAGFLFEAESAINENPLDRPTEEESVWRLAPTLEAVEDEALAGSYRAIGESNRMTLRFRKPRDA
jgi:predicted methyltransferase